MESISDTGGQDAESCTCHNLAEVVFVPHQPGSGYETGDWYEVSLLDGTRTPISYSTTPFDGKGFRDLGGAAVVPEPSSMALVGLAGAGGFAWALRRRRRSA